MLQQQEPDKAKPVETVAGIQILFSRRWCVQEIALAAKASVYLGSRQKMSWTKFAKAVAEYERRSEEIIRVASQHDKNNPGNPRCNLIESKAHGAHSLVHALEGIFRENLDGTREKVTPLEKLVGLLSNFQFSVLRDAIYSVLSMARNPRHHGNYISPDCEASTFDVYKIFVDISVAESKSLDIICTLFAKNKMGINLPTWLRLTTDRASSQEAPGENFARMNADTLVTWDYRLTDKVPPLGPRIRHEPFVCLLASGRKIGYVGELELCAYDGRIPLSWAKLSAKATSRITNDKNCYSQSMKVIDSDSDSNSRDEYSRGVAARPRARNARKQAQANITDAFWRTLATD